MSAAARGGVALSGPAATGVLILLNSRWAVALAMCIGAHAVFAGVLIVGGGFGVPADR